MTGKLLIVDDEWIIRQGITSLIQHNSLPWTIVGEAANGQEAIAIMDRVLPDVVLTDVRMPEMDGIGLARYISEHHKDIMVVILTGFKEFEYAQAALRFGATDFLLKPCPEQDVVNVLSRLYQSLQQRQFDMRIEEAAKLSAEENGIRSLLMNVPCDAAVRTSVERKFAGNELWLLRIADYFPATKKYRPSDLELLQFAVFNIVSELVRNREADERTVPLFYNTYVLVLKPSSWMEQDMQLIVMTVKQLLGIEVDLIKAGTIGEFERSLFMTQNAHAPGLQENPSQGTGMNRFAVNKTKQDQLQNELIAIISSGLTEELKSELDRRIGLLQALDVSEAKLEAMTLVLALQDIKVKIMGKQNQESIGIDELYEQDTQRKVYVWSRSSMELFLADFERWQDANQYNLVQKAVSYIEDHYMETCYLSEAAQYVHLSPGYFGNIFKKQTGESFVAYVTRIRMEKAKILLANTSMKVFEVAESVGYDDPNYFTTVFKQFFHMSPREFRKPSCTGPLSE